MKDIGWKRPLRARQWKAWLAGEMRLTADQRISDIAAGAADVEPRLIYAGWQLKKLQCCPMNRG
jgi:hypothetical protein